MIGDSGENEFVRGQAQQHVPGAWWIGRNDSAAEAFWRWENNEALWYGNWIPGQPDNFNNEDCATIESSSGMWNDLNCNGVALPFVCERDQGAASTTQNFVYSAADTNSATQNFRLAVIVGNPGSIVTVGTCGLPGASATVTRSCASSTRPTRSRSYLSDPTAKANNMRAGRDREPSCHALEWS
jgi:hypothetical protein